MKMACDICSKTMMDEGLYRNGKKGELVPFRCWQHLDPEWKEYHMSGNVPEVVASIESMQHAKQ